MQLLYIINKVDKNIHIKKSTRKEEREKEMGKKIYCMNYIIYNYIRP